MPQQPEDQSSPSPVEEGEEEEPTTAISQEEDEEEGDEDEDENDHAPTMFLTRRQNSVPGGRSLTQTGHEATIIQGSPFIYCGSAPIPINSHRRLAHHNSMRSPATYERERNNNTAAANGGNSINNNNNVGPSSSSSRRLKRHDTDPSMGKSGRSKMSSPSTTPAIDAYQDGYLNVPTIMQRDRASPSVGSVQSDPESCLDGYFYDEDDHSLIGGFTTLKFLKCRQIN